MTTIQYSGYGASEIIRVKTAGVRPYEVFKGRTETGETTFWVAFRGETGEGFITEQFEVTEDFFLQAAAASSAMRTVERQVGALTLAMAKSKRQATQEV